MSKQPTSPDRPRLRVPGSDNPTSPKPQAIVPLVDAPSPQKPSRPTNDDVDTEDLLADMGFEKIATLQMPPDLATGPGKTRPLYKALTMSKFDRPIPHAKRPGFTKVGRDITISLNSHRVEAYPTGDVFQYDVLIGKGDSEKRATIRAVWMSEVLQKALGEGWLFDGNRLAWNYRNIGHKTMLVDMDEEKGRPTRKDDSNKFRVQLRATKKIPMYALTAYLEKKTGFNTEVLEAINFIDHLLREWPSQRLISIKRSFFEKSFNDVTWMSGGIDGYKGIYQSIRPAEGGRLVVNADVSNTAFWRPAQLGVLCVELASPTPENAICAAIQKPGGKNTKMYKNVQRLRKLRVKVDYQNMSDRVKHKTFIIQEILGTNARNTYFSNVKDGKEVETSVFDYFKDHYDHRLSEAHLPVVLMTKGQLYPMEVCFVQKGQRYPFRLNEFQTAQMIRFAVTRPDVRRQAIEKGLAALDWANDPFHKGYGLKVNPKMIETKARVIPPPAVEFHAGKCEKPGTLGRWRIDGKQFIKPNTEPLTRWGVGVFNNWAADPRTKVTEVEVKRFLTEFIRLYKGYGGRVANNQPPILAIDDIRKCTEELWNRCTVDNKPPQLFVFVVNAKMTVQYNRVKKSCDCRFGVVSQVMQSAHVKKVNAQYIGNVLLKVNAKLGGFNFRANPNATITSTATKLDTVKLLPEDTVIIGADVSHAGAGSLQPSMAAMTVSMDAMACRYAAACQTNGNHIEMISTWNIYDMLRPLLIEWMCTVGKGRLPRNVMYFRDGVSEGQYQHVLQLELRDIKMLLRDLDQQHGKIAEQIKFTVIIASKRHHIRFFPKPGGNVGDKNNNALCGTVVERDVTHPTEYDFYLCAHFAIQGTARPVHYHVLVNEIGGTPDLLIKMIYNMSYQYARSTTPVSIFPAIYYAHLASKRAVSHDRKEVDEGFQYTSKDLSDLWKLEQARAQCDRTGKVMTKAAMDRLKQLTQAEFPTLLYMPESGPDANRIKHSMWYI